MGSRFSLPSVKIFRRKRSSPCCTTSILISFFGIWREPKLAGAGSCRRGVLNCDSTPNARKFPYIVDKQLLARFRELVSKTGATVVLSSTWRVDPVGRLAAKFYELPFDDICPDIPDAPRCEEIQSWLRQHPEATRYAVLDDDDDCLDELPLFQPSSKTGLTEEIAQGIEEFLAGRSDKEMRNSAIVRLGQNIHALFERNKS
jgi:hypothetical protein